MGCNSPAAGCRRAHLLDNLRMSVEEHKARLPTGIPCFVLTVRDTRAVYRGRVLQMSNEFRGLYSVPRDASLGPVLMNGPVVHGTGARSLAVAPGERVLFVGYSTISPAHADVLAAPSDGSLAPHRVTAPQSCGRFAFTYRLAPDGERVAYLADQRVDETYELFAATVSAGTAPVPYLGRRIGLP